MKRFFELPVIAAIVLFSACNTTTNETQMAAAADATVISGQSAVQDDVSQKDVVKVAASSKDHTTLVAAVKQAGLVDALSNAGPFTVFAPTNAAFDKLPKGTVEALMKDGKKADLENILQYHVYVGILKAEMMQDGQTFNEVNGDNITISKKDNQVVVNGTAHIIASIPASNGIIHVIDEVLLPPAKK